MAIPNYPQFMEPCLRVLRSSGLMSKPELVEKVSDEVGLTEEQRQVMLDSAKAPVAGSRISWAPSYMKQAGVVGAYAEGRNPDVCTPEQGSEHLTRVVASVTLPTCDPVYGAEGPLFDHWRAPKDP